MAQYQRRCCRHVATLTAVIAGVLLSPLHGRAESVEAFYRGKTIRLIIGSGEGGGFDISGRFVAEFLSRYIPGHPTVIPQNMPGASGIRAAEYMYQVAPHDGSVIALTQPIMLLNAVIDPKPHFLPQKFAWIGRFAALASYGIAWHAAPARTLEQAKTTPLIMGAAPGAGPGVTVVTALNKLAGTKFKVVQGYKSVSESALALERGELQGISSVSWEFLTSKHWTDGKTVSLLFVNAMERTQVKPDVPTIIDAVSDNDDRAVMKLIASVSDLGRAILAPPNVPPDRIDALRQAFDRFTHDPVAQAEAHRRNIDMDPLSGQAVEKLVINTMTVSPAVVEKARGVIPTH